MFDTDFWREALLQLIGGVPGALVVGIPLLYVLWRQTRQFKQGDERENVLIVSNSFEGAADDRTMMKPRTVAAARPVTEVFPQPGMAKAVIAAARSSNADVPEKAFITHDGQMHAARIGKKVVDIVSALGCDGHLARMFGHDVYLEEAYACITLARDGDVEIIRIDLIDRNDLRSFLDPVFRQSLQAREADQSHADMIEVFRICAEEVFAVHDKTVERKSLRAFRVSIPIPK